MVREHAELVFTLNHLLKVSADAERSFRLAVSMTDDRELKGLFSHDAEQIAEFCGELRAEVLKLGGMPDETGTQAGAMRRARAAAAANAAGRSLAPVVAACAKEHDETVRSFDEVLRRPGLTEELRQLVQQQGMKTREANRRVKQLFARRHDDVARPVIAGVEMYYVGA